MPPNLPRALQQTGGLAPSTDGDHSIRGSRLGAHPFDTPPLAWTPRVGSVAQWIVHWNFSRHGVLVPGHLHPSPAQH